MSLPPRNDGSLCSMLKHNSFQIMDQKTIQINTDQCEQLFIDCDDSSVSKVDMISNGIYDAFCNTESVCVILISNHANDVYRKLQLFSKLYHKQNEQKQIIYFTLNANDYLHKYKMLFNDFNHERIQKTLHLSDPIIVRKMRQI
eukprot:71236_1